MVTLLVPREQVKAVLTECIRTGEELVTQAEIVESAGGHSDWLSLFAMWRDRTLADLRTVYDGDEITVRG